MNKKIIFIIVSAGMLLMCSCGENQTEENPKLTEKATTSISDTAETTSAIITENQTSTQTVSVADTTIVSEVSSVSQTETTSVQQVTQVSQTSQISQNPAESVTVSSSMQTMETFTEPASQPFQTDDNGAVIMNVEKDTDESKIIAAAQELYENACKTEFYYHVGCPYNLDYNSHVENEYGWQYYLVTDEGYTSIADVEKDYYKIFAEERGNDLSEIYIEQDGRLYALDGARGANIFYENSEVTGITEKTDDKITFTVDNHYSGDDMNPDAPVTETEQFSVIIKNGEWRVSEFYLPY